MCAPLHHLGMSRDSNLEARASNPKSSTPPVASHFGLCSEAHGPERDRYVVISRPPPPHTPRIPPRGVSVLAPPSRLQAPEAAEASSNETEPGSANATTASPLLLTEACLPPDAPQASLAAFRARHRQVFYQSPVTCCHHRRHDHHNLHPSVFEH
jgi:hypothetical protein